MKFIKRVKKVFKCCLATSLCTAIAVTGTPAINAFANEVKKEKTDIYAQGMVENLEVEGITYEYKYYYDANGNRSISITNTNNNSVENVTYDEGSSTGYLNNKKAIRLENTDKDGDVLDSKQSKVTWNLLGTKHKKLTFLNSITITSMVALIAVAIGYAIPAAKILASCGSAVIGSIIKQGTGGTLHWTGWYYTSAFYYHYKFDWAFKAPSGERFGTYQVVYYLE